MIKKGLKNFFHSLKYVFTPLGTMLLGLAVGLSVLIPGLLAALNTLTEGLRTLSANANLNVDVLAGALRSSLGALDWRGGGALRTIFSQEWLDGLITRTLRDILGMDFAAFQTQASALIDAFAAEAARKAVVFLVWWALGFAAGFFVLRFQLRRDLARSGVVKTLAAALMNAVFLLVFLAALGAVRILLGWSVLLSTVLLFVLLSLLSLLEAYLLHGRGAVELRRVVNAKTVGLYTLVNLLIFLLSLAVSLTVLALNPLAGLFLTLALLEITVNVMDLNAESFLLSSPSAESPPPAKP